MALFLGDIAFLLELALVAAGLVLLHFGRKEASALLSAAGYVLLIGGIATALCTVTYLYSYFSQGELAHAYPHHDMAGMMKMMNMHQGSSPMPGMSAMPGMSPMPGMSGTSQP